jgi:signal transduction histidine kinase
MGLLRTFSGLDSAPKTEDAGDGTWLVGTDGGGLCRLDPTEKRFSPCTDKNMLNAKTVFHVVVARSGEIWIATATGFGKLDLMNRTYQHIPVPDSITPRPIIRLTEDDAGRLWLSTLQDGIYRFDPHTGKLDHFDESDGLQSNQFFSASCKLSNSEIILGGEKGYNIFNPDHILGNAFIPPVVLTSFKVFGKDHVPRGVAPEIQNIELTYDQNYFSFEFAGLDYSSPTRNQYAYKLDGLENDWVVSEQRRFASYTSVPPGEYTFRVKASNSDGIWNEKGLAIPIIITPPFWETTWFRTLMVLFVVGILVSIYNYLAYQIRQMEGVRRQIADDLHDDVGSMLTTIRLRIDLFRKHIPPSSAKEGEHLSIASQVSSQAHDALRSLVWFLNPEHDRADDIIAKMRERAGRMLIQIDHSFDEDARGSMPIMDMAFRRNLILLYQESLNNIVKHSKATKVAINVKTDDKVVHLTISDNGTGFDTEKKKDGHGLGTLKHRAEQMKGSLDVKSSPGEGTTIFFRAPLPQLPLVARFKSSAMNLVHSTKDLFRNS